MTTEDDWLQARRKLAAVLGCADDEAFLLLIWGVNALQSGRPESGGAVFPFGYPPEAATQDLSHDLAIYAWELETISNELLASPKSIYRTFPCNRWDAFAEVVNLLRRIDELDFAVREESVNIFRELFRISGRQFDWQRGYFNIPQFYRNIYIYGQGACAEYFREKYGIGINEFTAVGFGMYASLVQRPNFSKNSDFGLVSVTPGMRDKVLSILAAPLSELRQLAARERAQWETMAYRPSVLRRFPCVRYGRRGWKIRSPLPALIVERITSGLFYDVVTGDGAIRDDYGRRFEQYAMRYLREMLPTLHVEPESGYKVSKNRFDSPDILISSHAGTAIRLAIECKASRMSFGARFADEPATERGYDDIVKAIFQLWRYFSHCRRGLTGRALEPDAIGLVLTLDSWMVMATEMFDQIFERANVSADKSEPPIETQDRRPIAFCSIPDFESALAMGTADTFLAAVRAAADPQRRGGYIEQQHESILGENVTRRDYPFDGLAALLPWWGTIESGGPPNNVAGSAD